MSLAESNVDPNPFRQFDLWRQAALACPHPLPVAMTLATAAPDGKPSARIVLLKGCDEEGLVFYTNYQSRKGRELTSNPQAALVLWWDELKRQIRLEGRIEQTTSGESDAYFNSRPRESNLAAMASAQSEAIPARGVLEKRFADLTAAFENKPLIRPPHWGGFRLRPEMFEFWQDGAHRLHDRLRYTKKDNGDWSIERLAP